MSVVDLPVATGLFEIGQGDTLPILTATLLQNGLPINLETATEVRFNMTSRDKRRTVVDGVVVVLDALNGRVSYTWQTGDTTNAGEFFCEFVVTFPSGQLTVPNGPTKTVIRVNAKV